MLSVPPEMYHGRSKKETEARGSLENYSSCIQLCREYSGERVRAEKGRAHKEVLVRARLGRIRKRCSQFLVIDAKKN